MLAGSVAIFSLVMGLLLAAFRRAPPAGGDAVPKLETVWIYWFGIAFPVVVLAVLLTYGLVLGEALLPRTSNETVRVRAEARQWAWTFSYADAPGRRTHGVLHIPARKPVDVAISTTDVVHSFWVPRLGGKLDAIPGHVNILRIEATTPGRYSGVSAEFSGDGYGGHSFEVVAHDPDQWSAFLMRGHE